jgi:hypothetical protein
VVGKALARHHGSGTCRARLTVAGMTIVAAMRVGRGDSGARHRPGPDTIPDPLAGPSWPGEPGSPGARSRT